MLRTAALVLLGAAGCGGGIAVNTDYDPLAGPRMEAWRSWTWLPHPDGRNTRPDSTLASLIRTEIERSLDARGYRQADTTPEFRVGWHAILAEPIHITALNAYYGYAFGRWYPGGGVAYSRGFQTEYFPGTLIMDVVDARTNDLIWRGVAREVLGEKQSQAERSVALSQAVTRLLAQFPPSRNQ
jgi:hypothetical protein